MRPRHGRIPRGGRPMAISWEARGARPTAARAGKGRAMASRMESRRQRGRGTPHKEGLPTAAHPPPEGESALSRREGGTEQAATQPQRRTTNRQHNPRHEKKENPSTTINASPHPTRRGEDRGGKPPIVTQQIPCPCLRRIGRGWAAAGGVIDRRLLWHSCVVVRCDPAEFRCAGVSFPRFLGRVIFGGVGQFAGRIASLWNYLHIWH